MYVFIWYGGIDLFYSTYWSCVIDLVVLDFYCVWIMSQVLLCLRLDEMRLSISYEFFYERDFNDYDNVCINFNYALLFATYMPWTLRKGLYKTTQRSSTRSHTKSAISSRVWSLDLTEGPDVSWFFKVVLIW